jgi:hypothetical protein
VPYCADAWSVFHAASDHRERPEYKLAEWMARHRPGARAFAVGSVRLWYNAWHDGEQVGGGSDQGLLNHTLALAQWQVIHDTVPDRAIAWLQAVGADAVIVSQPESAEIFHEWAAPGKFEGHLPALFDDGAGNRIYGVPRRFPAHARVVETRTLDGLRPIPFSDYDRPELQAYLAAVENGPDAPVDMRWDGPAAVRLRARLDAGQSLLVQESYDPAWHAWSGGREFPIVRDVAGFMRVDAPPGEQEVRLVFTTPLENRVGQGLTLLSLGVLGALGVLSGRRAGRPPPQNMLQ